MAKVSMNTLAKVTAKMCRLHTKVSGATAKSQVLVSKYMLTKVSTTDTG